MYKTNLELSKALALAIGWPEELLIAFSSTGNFYIRRQGLYDAGTPFNYLDWAIIAPIAQRYNCFPKDYYGNGTYWVSSFRGKNLTRGDMSPQKAIALAVIEGLAKEELKVS